MPPVATATSSSEPSVDVYELPGSSAAVPEARRHFVSVLSGWGVSEDTMAERALVVSELVTNAVKHALGLAAGPIRPHLRVRGAVVMRLLPYPGHLVMQVADPSSAKPVLTTPVEGAESGWGLGLVAAAGEWGSYPTAFGKVVWCRVAMPGVAPRSVSISTELDDPRFLPTASDGSLDDDQGEKRQVTKALVTGRGAS